MAILSENRRNKIFWIIGISVAAIYIFLRAGVYYTDWEAEKRIEQFANDIKRIQEENLALKTADTIGGKTPKETLDLYISAVEEGNYELASKYVVIEKQEEELNILKNSSKENIDNIIDLMKKTNGEFSNFSGEEKSFSVHKPILISFVKYPTGNWKIEEI